MKARRHSPLLLAATALLALGCGRAVAAGAEEPLSSVPAAVVCVVPASAAEGLDREALEVALSVEARKAGQEVRIVMADRAATCPPLTSGAPVLHGIVGPDARATLVDARGPALPLDLTAVPAMDRATEVARSVMSRFRPAAPGQPPALVDLDSPVELAKTGAPEDLDPTPPLEWAVWLGGGYSYEIGGDRSYGLVAIEGEISWLDRRLAAAVGATWRPEQDVGAEGWAAAATAVEALVTVRGGLWAGPVLIRAGIGGGWLWRRFEGRPDTRFSSLNAESSSGVLALEAEAVWEPLAPLALSLVVPGRVYFGGTTLRWQGQALDPAPAGAVGAVLRAGVMF